MTARTLTILVGTASAVLTFLLAQPDVVLPAWAKVTIAALNIGLTVFGRLSDPRGTPPTATDPITE